MGSVMLNRDERRILEIVPLERFPPPLRFRPLVIAVDEGSLQRLLDFFQPPGCTLVARA